MVGDPGDYRWSSYLHHAGHCVIEWMSEPLEYSCLAPNSDARAQVYREICKQKLATFDLEAIRSHLNKDSVLGSSNFQNEIESVLGRRTKIVPQGRPKKKIASHEK